VIIRRVTVQAGADAEIDAGEDGDEPALSKRRADDRAAEIRYKLIADGEPEALMLFQAWPARRGIVSDTGGATVLGLNGASAGVGCMTRLSGKHTRTSVP